MERLQDLTEQSIMDTFLKRTIRRHELRRLVPLADTTIYTLEKNGQFPKRFYLTERCVVWDLAEVEAWIESKRASTQLDKAPCGPDVRHRKQRPVKGRQS